MSLTSSGGNTGHSWPGSSGPMVNHIGPGALYMGPMIREAVPYEEQIILAFLYFSDGHLDVGVVSFAHAIWQNERMRRAGSPHQ